MRKLGRDRLILLCVVLLPMLLWWVVFFPGTFTNDSLAIIEQIRTGNWSNDHTNAYLSFVWLTSGGGSQWGLVTLAQVILVALGITSLGSVVRRIGIPKPVVMVACGVFSMLPQVGAFAITMWKDVPSTAGALMLAAALLEHHVAHRGVVHVRREVRRRDDEGLLQVLGRVVAADREDGANGA